MNFSVFESLLPLEVFLYLLEYVDYETKIELGSCCQRWHSSWMRQFLRKLSFRFEDRDTISLINSCEEKLKLVSRPYHQISLYLRSVTVMERSINFLCPLNYELNLFDCNQVVFLEMMKSIARLRIQHLSISDVKSASAVLLEENFHKIVDLKSLALKYSLPVFDGCRNIIIRLQHLSLHCCGISDVTMLGSIPSLDLKYCYGLVDISALNHNNRIVIERCDEILDYSHSFMYSRQIRIVLKSDDGNYQFDLSRWKNVQYLKLKTVTSTINFIDPEHRQLPFTIKRCELWGSFISSLDITITPNHVLHELKLFNDSSLHKLEGYGFERVTLIECEFMSALQSVEGLTGEKNQRIIFRHCHNITDFSPISHIPIVCIMFCIGFTNPLQVRSVQDLTLIPCNNITFQTIGPENPYQQIRSLSLLYSGSHYFLKQFDGLEKIPYLQFTGMNHFLLMKRFVESQKQPLQNQQIILYDDLKQIDMYDLRAFHRRYMKERYSLYHRKFKTWIWTRIVE